MSQNIANQSTGGSVGASSQALVGTNPGRRFLSVVNDHATQVLYLQFQTGPSAPTAVAGQGIRLNAAGGTYAVADADVVFKGAIAIIGSGAATTYTLVEY